MHDETLHKTVSAAQTVPKKSGRGFTLLFAVLVSVLVIAVGASIISIALKQVLLSGSGRESQFAFYASNTGLECALYWDLHPHDTGDGTLEYVFPAYFPDDGIDQPTWDDPDAIRCGGGKILNGDEFDGAPFTDSGYSWEKENNTYRFRMAITNDIDDQNNDSVSVQYCAEVTVTKAYSDVTGRITTTISSNGLNTCDPDDNQRAVERGLVLEYES